MLQQQPLVWGEIAVEDIARAQAFYVQHFDVTFRQQTMSGMQMAIIETELEQAASVALVKHETMRPSKDGSVVYLHVSDQLSPLVARLERAGVEIVMPAMAINDGECGYSCLFIDSEGNKVGLWSPSLTAG
ncbi:VOC family protein [Shewanella algidipiscicola]|uniref:Glyoxalase n=1 Tax=Shewanella algidipiscicola TaxID=614070 RepID=A0ABQ4PHJ3_9GAMM|nr:VOC family protein [Shewanella algidipiscicola]GIU46899.1 glyoxalase [Shewanella algidipiscicola]